MSRSETMRFARGLYDTGKNRVASHVEVGSHGRLCIVTVDGSIVARGATWPLCYSNLRFHADEEAAK